MIRRPHSIALGVAVLAVGLLVAPAAGRAAGRSRFVRVPGTAVAGLAGLRLSPVRRLAYGSFEWLELYEEDLARLAASDLPYRLEPDAGTVQVTRYRFDPLVGEPDLPAGLAAAETGAPGLRLVQLVAPVTDAWVAELRAAGVELLQYYPFDTFLVWTDAARAAAVARLDFVRWTGLFHPAYKISPDLNSRQGRIDDVSVFFHDDGAVESTLDEIRRLGGEILLQYPAQPDGAFRIAVARLDAGAVDAVARLPAVVWLGYRSPRLELEDEMSDQIVAGNHPGGVPVVGYQDHLDTLGVDGSGVVWAITDTGVDFDHPELGSRIVGGWSGAGACSPPGSDCASGGHGTHVAGITGGDGSTGIADTNGFLCGLGMAPAYSIFAMNIFFGSDPLQEYSKQAVLGGAIGSNNSWTTGEGTCHGYQDSERTYDIMVRDGNFDTPGVAEPQIIVFSAGNSGPGACTLTAPKEAKNVIVTGGTKNFRIGGIDELYTLSSRGPTVDGRFGPTIVTPGQLIYSTRNDLGGACATQACNSSLHSNCSGTSMAAPHASGALILISEWWRGLTGGADPSPAMAKALLVNGAVDISGAGPIPNTAEGWGRVNFTHVIDPGVPSWYSDQQIVLGAAGEATALDLSVADPGKPVKISLAWSDAPGAVGANPALVNDLDLEVEDGATLYRGNVFSGGWSVPGGVADALNNQENVFIQTPSAPFVRLRVVAGAINGDGVPFSGDTTDQDYAIVCTNCLFDRIFDDGFESGDTTRWTSAVE